MRVILLEQLYRGERINAGERYRQLRNASAKPMLGYAPCFPPFPSFSIIGRVPAFAGIRRKGLP